MEKQTIKVPRRPFAYPPKPYIGQPCTVRGVECTITRILPFRTLECAAVDGSMAFRVSGLFWEE